MRAPGLLPVSLIVGVVAVGCGRSALPIASGGPAATDGGVDAQQGDSGSEPSADAEAAADAETDAPDVQQPAADCGAAAGLITLASGQKGLRGLAIDQANIYWLLNTSASGQNGTVTVMKESLCGGPVSTLATVPGNAGSSLVTDGREVYWAEKGVVVNAIQETPNALFSVPVEGGAVSTLWSSLEGEYLRSLAVDPTGVYGTVWPGTALVRVPLAGGTTTTFASGLYAPEGLTVAGTMVYWVAVDEYSGGMPPKPGALLAMPIGGGTPVTFAQGGADPGEVVTNSTNLIWTSGGTDPSSQISALVTEPLAGGATTTLAGPFTYWPLGAIAADNASVYFGVANPGLAPSTLMKVDVTGASPPKNLASASVYGLAVDSTSVYWTDGVAGSVMKLTPK
jgi:hypothetical protein